MSLEEKVENIQDNPSYVIGDGNNDRALSFDDDDELQMLMDDWYAYITIMPIMLYVYFFAHTYIYILDDFIIESSSKQQISKKKIYSIYIIISSVKNIL